MTFYTVSKLNVLCGPTDHKIALNRGWSYLNLLLSTIAIVGGLYWLLVHDGSNSDSLLGLYFITGVPLYILGAFFTIIFLHYDCLFCASCCAVGCCAGEKQVVIHDPSNPEANLVWKNKQVSMSTNYCAHLRSFLNLITRLSILIRRTVTMFPGKRDNKN